MFCNIFNCEKTLLQTYMECACFISNLFILVLEAPQLRMSSRTLLALALLKVVMTWRQIRRLAEQKQMLDLRNWSKPLRYFDLQIWKTLRSIASNWRWRTVTQIKQKTTMFIAFISDKLMIRLMFGFDKNAQTTSCLWNVLS